MTETIENYNAITDERKILNHTLEELKKIITNERVMSKITIIKEKLDKNLSLREKIGVEVREQLLKSKPMSCAYLMRKYQISREMAREIMEDVAVEETT